MDPRAAQSTPPFFAEGFPSQLMTTRDGSLFTADWLMRMALGGYCYQAAAGTVTTPLTFNATGITTTAPDFDLLCPAGTVVIPYRIQIKMEAFGTTAIFETMASVGVGGAQGTDTDMTPTNLLMNNPRGASACTVANVGTGATYMTSNVSEFWRDGIAKVATVGTGDDDSNRQGEWFEWSAIKTGVWPILYHPTSASRLNVFAASQAGTGFITVQWVELPSSFQA